MSFDPEQLKRIALARREIEKAAVKEDDVPRVIVGPLELAIIIEDIESTVVAYAEDGNLFVPYPFKEGVSAATISQIANTFKSKHPRLMVIESIGERKITINWDGQNNV